MKLKRFGLIGKPLSHSFSPAFFKEYFIQNGIIDSVYDLFELESIEEIKQLIATNTDLVGLNVTIPYKEAILNYVDFASQEVEAIGASNCLHIQNGKVYAYNTDYLGFLKSLQELGFQGKNALILGTGGSSKAVQFALQKLSVNINTVSRSVGQADFTYQELQNETLTLFDLIVNTTPLGMSSYPEQVSLISLDGVITDTLIYDIIYNPPKTPLS